MKIVPVNRDRIIEPCSLEFFGYQIDPYVGCEHRCSYCYTQNRSDLDWKTEVGVFPELTERVAEELSELKPQTIYIGMNTDPYQPLETEYQQTRRILEQLTARGFSACILTKSDLVTRDIDLLAKMADASVGVSISFYDEAARRLFEESPISTAGRVGALAEFKRRGIETYVLISPVMPLISDVDAIIDRVRSHADTVWVYSLEVCSEKDRNWQQIESILSAHFPEIRERFQKIAFSSDHDYWKDLRRKLEHLQKRENLNLEIRI